MDTLNHVLADDLAETLTRLESPADELDRMADLHRRGMATYVSRASAARKAGKAAVAELEDERRQAKILHARNMQRIDDEIARLKEETADQVATAEKLAAVSRTALEALQG